MPELPAASPRPAPLTGGASALPGGLPLYLRLARYYQGAIHSGVLPAGQRLPSVRQLMREHGVSLSTALMACRHLEDVGDVQARPRAGYFVRGGRAERAPRLAEPTAGRLPDPAQYVGMHAKVSRFITLSEAARVQVDLGAAYAAAELYPGAALQAAVQRALRREPALLTTPAPNAGHPALRQVLARRALATGWAPAPESLLVTQGCIEGLTVALRAVTEPGDTVAVECPGYYGLLQVLESLGLKALELPTSPHTGLCLDSLAAVLAATEPGAAPAAAVPATRPKALVVVPNFHNPTGALMPDATKAALVALCARHGLPLIEDDCYSTFTPDDTPLKSLKAWDTDGGVIHCASLRKSLAPGMRLGWLQGGRWHARIAMLKHASSRANDALPQLAAAELLGSGAFDRHLARLRQRLSHQRQQLADAVQRDFPAGTRLSPPAGGLMLWVELPEGRDAGALFEPALAQGIRFVPGALCANSGRWRHGLRLGFGSPVGPPVLAALRTLGRLAQTLPTQVAAEARADVPADPPAASSPELPGLEG